MDKLNKKEYYGEIMYSIKDGFIREINIRLDGYIKFNDYDGLNITIYKEDKEYTTTGTIRSFMIITDKTNVTNTFVNIRIYYDLRELNCIVYEEKNKVSVTRRDTNFVGLANGENNI